MGSWKNDGNTLNIEGSKGRYPFTVSRLPGYSVGVYYINFGDNPCSDANYVISITVQGNACCKVWENITPTINGFHITIYTTSLILIDLPVYFAVLA